MQRNGSAKVVFLLVLFVILTTVSGRCKPIKPVLTDNQLEKSAKKKIIVATAIGCGKKTYALTLTDLRDLSKGDPIFDSDLAALVENNEKLVCQDLNGTADVKAHSTIRDLLKKMLPRTSWTAKIKRRFIAYQPREVWINNKRINFSELRPSLKLSILVEEAVHSNDPKERLKIIYQYAAVLNEELGKKSPCLQIKYVGFRYICDS